MSITVGGWVLSTRDRGRLREKEGYRKHCHVQVFHAIPKAGAGIKRVAVTEM